MKKLILTAIIPIFIIACKNIDGLETIQKGSLQITIGSNNGKAITSDDSSIASANTNLYEVLVYNDATVISTQLDLSDNTTTLSVETGVYTVLILAGYSSSSEGILLGSGYIESITVIENNLTNVAISLTSISHDFTVPETVTCSEEYTVTAAGNTNNPMLQISYDGTIMENRPYVEIGDDALNIYLTCTVSGSSWTGSTNLIASALAEQTNIELFGSNIKIVDPVFAIDEELKNFGSINWKWINASLIPDGISSESGKNIEFITASSGVNIEITWS